MENSTGVTEDSLFEGKDQVYLDIDRMINEGLSGGTVKMTNHEINIEEVRDLKKETSPKKTE